MVGGPVVIDYKPIETEEVPGNTGIAPPNIVTWAPKPIDTDTRQTVNPVQTFTPPIGRSTGIPPVSALPDWALPVGVVILLWFMFGKD